MNFLDIKYADYSFMTYILFCIVLNKYIIVTYSQCFSRNAYVGITDYLVCIKLNLKAIQTVEKYTGQSHYLIVIFNNTWKTYPILIINLFEIR